MIYIILFNELFYFIKINKQFFCYFLDINIYQNQKGIWISQIFNSIEFAKNPVEIFVPLCIWWWWANWTSLPPPVRVI